MLCVLLVASGYLIAEERFWYEKQSKKVVLFVLSFWGVSSLGHAWKGAFVYAHPAELCNVAYGGYADRGVYSVYNSKLLLGTQRYFSL